MKKIIALGGSLSQKSINQQLAVYSANQLEGAETVTVDLNDYLAPIYSPEIEEAGGIPKEAQDLYTLISSADGLVVSLAEYNGSYSSGFKNIFDWMSRINQKVWNDIPMLLMSTSPGGRGGQGVLASAKMAFPHLGGNIVGEFSLPSFYDNFTLEGIKNEEQNSDLNTQIKALQEAI